MATQARRMLSVRVAQSRHRPEETAAELEGVRWRKSTFSAGGECVGVAEVGSEVALRNDNRPEMGALWFSRRQLAAWVAGCKAGELDDLTTA
jgi:hypothetical protein